MAFNTFANTVTITNGTAQSTSIPINGSTPILVIAPAAWTAANIQFEGSLDGTNFFPCRDMLGSLIQITVTAGAAHQVPPSMLHGYDHVRLRSVTAGTTTNVNQGADRVITIVTEKLTS